MRREKLWKKTIGRTLGATVLGGVLVFTEIPVAYGAAANVQLPAAQTAEAGESAEVSIEDYLFQCWKNKIEKIDMTSYDITRDEMDALLNVMRDEHPELYWTSKNYNYDWDKETGIVKTYWQYYVTQQGYPLDRSEELEREWEVVKAKTEKCKTDLEKVLVVHEHLCDTITYSFDLGTMAHDIEGAILEKKAVCEGYADAFKYYMNRLGIPCNSMGGVANNGAHAWNQVEINGKWYLIDATWDDPADSKSAVGHQYFMCSKYIFSDHQWSNKEEDYEPCEDTTYDNAFWRRFTRGISAYQGGLYYSDLVILDSGEMEMGIFRVDAENPGNPGELVVSVEDMWKDDPNGTQMSRGRSELVYYQDHLYYNTPKAVWKWNFDPQADPEKVLELEEGTDQQIWNVEMDGGTLLYETAAGAETPRVTHEYPLDENYQKAEHPIAVTDTSMTVELGGPEVFLQAVAPGALTYEVKDPEICELDTFYGDGSSEIIPKKAGNTQIVVHAKETNRYLAGELVIDVTVVDNGEQTVEYEIQASAPEEITYGDEASVEIKIIDRDTQEEVSADDKNIRVTPGANVIYENGKIKAVGVGGYSLMISADGMQSVMLEGSVVKRPATVKAADVTRNQEEEHIAPTVTVENRAGFDTTVDFGISVACEVTQDTTAGTYPITVSGGNEYFLSRYTPTYENGTYTVEAPAAENYQVSAKAVLEDGTIAEGAAVSLKDAEGNAIASGSAVLEGTKLTAEAGCPENMTIVKWVINGKDYAANPTVSFTLESDTEVQLVLAEKPEEHIHAFDHEKPEDMYKADDATCTTPATYYKSCECGARGEETFEFGEALGHDYGAPVWNWADDASSAKAVFTCGRDESHTEEIDAGITSEVTKPATCTQKGETTYTASVIFGETESSDTKTVQNIEKLGHDYGAPIWNWADDASSAKAVFTCGRDESHTEEIDAEITSKVTKPATCTQKGETTYTASVIFGETESSDTKTVKNIEKTAHSFAYGKCGKCGAQDPDYAKYEIAGGVWEKGDKEGIVINIPTEIGEAAQFTIDGKALNKDAYSVEGGKLTIRAEALEALAEGEHVVQIRGTKGLVEKTVKVQKEAVVDPPKPEKPDTENPTDPPKPEDPNPNPNPPAEPSKPDHTNQNVTGQGAKTGDNSRTSSLLALAGGAMLAGIAVYKKKREEEI